MAEKTSQRNTQRNQRNDGNNRPLGMVITKLKPLSSEFYTHFHEKNRAGLRQFNAISNAIYNLFRLVESDQATTTKVNKWLNGVYDELSVNVNAFKEQIDKNIALIPVEESSFDGYDYEEFEIRWNHPLTWKLLDIIQTINVMTRQANQLWLYGKVTQQVHSRIVLQLFGSLRVAMDNITKILDADNRVDGKYDALPFIQNIKRFKSVDLYIASLETKVQTPGEVKTVPAVTKPHADTGNKNEPINQANTEQPAPGSVQSGDKSETVESPVTAQ